MWRFEAGSSGIPFAPVSLRVVLELGYIKKGPTVNSWSRQLTESYKTSSASFIIEDIPPFWPEPEKFRNDEGILQPMGEYRQIICHIRNVGSSAAFKLSSSGYTMRFNLQA